MSEIEKAIDLCKKQVSCFETDCMAECVGCPNESSPDDFKSALQLIIIPALQEKQEREHPAVLSLEELRQMDEEPVYCVAKNNQALTGWGLVSVKENRIFDNAGDWWDLGDCGIGYQAYAHKPEQEESNE